MFSARHSVEGDVVLKLIKPGQEVERVRREIEAVDRVRSKRVPRILAVGTVNTQVGELFWLREERIQGHSLRQILGAGPLTSATLLRMGCHVLEALVAAEQVRIVHRDVKPENIMIGAKANGWLLDFGLARHLDLESVTASAQYFGVGTPGYAPPEQFRNRKREIDSRADLFGLGVTLYECTTGENPFRSGARDLLDVLRRVEREPLRRIAAAWDVRGEMADFVSALTQRHREHRPPTAAGALVWLQEICSHIDATVLQP